MKRYLMFLLVLLINFNSNISKVYSQMKKPVYDGTCELNEFELNMTIEQINKEIAKLERKRQTMDADRWKLNRLKDMQNYQYNHVIVNKDINNINDLPPFKLRLPKDYWIAGFDEIIDEITGEKRMVFDASLYTYSKDTTIEIIHVNMYTEFDHFRKKYKDKIDHVKLTEIEDNYKTKYFKYCKTYIISKENENPLSIQISLNGRCYLEEWTKKYKLLFYKKLYEQVKLSE